MFFFSILGLIVAYTRVAFVPSHMTVLPKQHLELSVLCYC